MTRNRRRNSRSPKALSEMIRLTSAVVLIGAVSAWQAPVYAQGELRKGETSRGSLSTSDPKLDDDSFYDMWTYRASAGESVKITLRSSDFDAYLAVGKMDGDKFESDETDDDGAGGTDAEVKTTFSEAGVYHIRVNSLAAGEKGAYTLVVEEGPVSTPPVSQGTLNMGSNVTGTLSEEDPTLDDDSHYDLWTYHGRSGETIRVTLRSDDFDAYLSFGEIDGDDFTELESDDDGAGGTDAKLTVTLSNDGDFVVRVNSLSEGETGEYTLLLEQGDPSEVSAGDEHEHADGEEGGTADPLPEPTAIRSGQTVNGELSDSDPKMDDNSRYDLYSFSGRRGQQVVVTMRSTVFDAYMALGQVDGGSFTSLESDDDTGGGDDSQITYRITRDGVYVIRANSLFASVTGAYTLQMELGEAPPQVPVTTQPIRYGQTVNGELSVSDPQMDDDSHFDLWKFTGRQGDKIVITMKSTVFDTYAAFGRMEEGEFTQIESDDDGAGGTDSKIEYTLESDGEYIVRANSLFSKGLGAYSLNITRSR
jgi:plastocyanin